MYVCDKDEIAIKVIVSFFFIEVGWYIVPIDLIFIIEAYDIFKIDKAHKKYIFG